MLMFGEKLNDIQDINLNINKIINKKKIKNNDIKYIERLTTKLNILHKLYKKDYDKYSLITKKEYDKKF